MLRPQLWSMRGVPPRPMRGAGRIQSVRVPSPARESVPRILQDARSHQQGAGRNPQTTQQPGVDHAIGNPHRHRAVPRSTVYRAQGARSQRNTASPQHRVKTLAAPHNQTDEIRHALHQSLGRFPQIQPPEFLPTACVARQTNRPFLDQRGTRTVIRHLTHRANETRLRVLPWPNA